MCLVFKLAPMYTHPRQLNSQNDYLLLMSLIVFCLGDRGVAYISYYRVEMMQHRGEVKGIQ